MAKGLATELYTPVVTTSLKQMVTGFQFVGHGADDLSTGCQPFQVAYSGGAHHLQALANASIGNQLEQGDQNASLTDYRTLREKEKVKFPKDTTEICVTLARYVVLCQTLFQGTGAANPYVESLWQLVANMQNAAPFIAERHQQMVRTPAITTNLYFACIVRSVQVQVQAYEYLQQVGVNMAEGHAGVDLPEFKTLVTDLRRGTFPYSNNLVPLPAEYLETARSTTIIGTRTTSTTTSPGGVSGGSVQTGVSSLTEATRVSVGWVDNPHPDNDFASITLRPSGTRPVLREHPSPHNDAGQELCVAWWLRSGCFPNCGRRATHCAFASANERTHLLTYCRERLSAPGATTT